MVLKITSVHNERVKYVRSLARRRVRQREGRFLVEGTRLVGEMIRAGIRPAFVLYTNDWATTPEAQSLFPSLALAEEGAWPVSDAVLAACADTQTPQGVVAITPFVTPAPRAGLLLILDQLRDPGNLGTILRSAEAAGVGQVVLTPGTVDLYNPKAVRGGMGAHFRLSVIALDWVTLAQHIDAKPVWLADTAGKQAYDAVDWTVPSALIVGGETTGVSQEASGLATGTVAIPMAGETESLNAAMAATVILFEAARQRRAQALCIGETP
jgi:TrmH family RNA methyltransferase